MPRRQLQKEFGDRWPTFVSDFDDAKHNGLGAAKIKHGRYSRAGVLAWAEARDKLREPSALSSLPVTRHRPR